jgi:tRNA threonylcarbamoyl adenosine modification protein (Sua5/YciO/YrdC/YwlC family)
MVPRIMLTKRQTVGIRVPDHPICLAIVEALGHPIISTSATNPENGGILSTPREIQDRIGHAINLIVDGGVVPGVASSIISLIDDSPEILREGAGDLSTFRAQSKRLA